MSILSEVVVASGGASPQKLDALTGLRFLASAAIVFRHIGGNYGFPRTDFPLASGVTMFFVLSGFILTYVYPELPTSSHVKKYLVARVARIWPLHFVCFLLVILLCSPIPASMFPQWATSALANVLLIQAWVPVYSFSLAFNSVSWTISIEMFFYLAFPLLIASFSSTWHWKLVASFAGLLFMCALSQSLGIVKFDPTLTNTPTMINTVGIFPLARLFEFVAGMCCCLAWRRWGHFLPTQMWLATIAEVLAFLLLFAAGFYLAVASFWVERHLGAALSVWIIVGGALAPVMVIVIGVLATGRGLISWVLSSPPMILLGEMSFAIYMVHQIVQRTLVVHFYELANYSPLVALTVFFGTTLLASAALYFVIERPCRKLITSHYSRLARLVPGSAGT